MSRIKGKNTGLEIRVRKALWAKGLRYRLGFNIPGKPDLVFLSDRIAVFIDGCFWHGCPLHSTKPKTNKDFWHKKLQGNIERDRKVNHQLQEIGWIPFRIWEHEIEEDVNSVIDRISELLRE
jgi:DNA mismatch endonuclease (patch repair protein)